MKTKENKPKTNKEKQKNTMTLRQEQKRDKHDQFGENKNEAWVREAGQQGILEGSVYSGFCCTFCFLVFDYTV